WDRHRPDPQSLAPSGGGGTARSPPCRLALLILIVVVIVVFILAPGGDFRLRRRLRLRLRLIAACWLAGVSVQLADAKSDNRRVGCADSRGSFEAGRTGRAGHRW